MADEFKRKLGSGVVALIGVEDGKASAVVGVTDDLSKTLSAAEGEWNGRVQRSGEQGGHSRGRGGARGWVPSPSTVFGRSSSSADGSDFVSTNAPSSSLKKA